MFPSSSQRSSIDRVFLHGLTLSAAIGPEAWHRHNRPQPVILDVRMPTSIELAANTDNVVHTIHYGHLGKAITKLVQSGKNFESIKIFADEICKTALGPGGGKQVVELTVTLPKALLLAQSFGIVTQQVRQLQVEDSSVMQLHTESERLFVQGMKLACIIGVNPHERLEKQHVVVDLSFYDVADSIYKGYAVLVKKVTDSIETSSYETLEALAAFIAEVVILDGAVGSVTVSVQKPSALTFVGGAGVEITRDKQFFLKDKHDIKEEL